MTATAPTSARSSQPPTDLGDRHLNGLAGAATVPTEGFQMVQLLLGGAVDLNNIAAVSGPAGSGKSFAVDHFVRTHPAMRGREWHWLDMPPKPTTKEVTVRLMDAVGVRRRRGDTEYDLTELLVPALQGSQRVVVIDEAQNLQTTGLQQLRYLHDRGRPSSWTLLLVGSTVHTKLSKAQELASRVSAWVQFEPLTDRPLLQALQSWHPVLRDLSPKLLLRIDDIFGRGNFRNWAQFLRALLTLLDQQPAGTIPDTRLVQAALAAVSPSRVRAR